MTDALRSLLLRSPDSSTLTVEGPMENDPMVNFPHGELLPDLLLDLHTREIQRDRELADEGDDPGKRSRARSKEN